jgi:ankyrin repeat protein
MLRTSTPSLFSQLKEMILKKEFTDSETIEFMYQQEKEAIKKYLLFTYGENNIDINHILESYKKNVSTFSKKEYKKLLSLIDKTRVEKQAARLKKNLIPKEDLSLTRRHTLAIVNKVDKKDNWIAKVSLSNTGIIGSTEETTSQEADRSMRGKYQPKTRLAVNLKKEIYVISEEIKNLTHLSDIETDAFQKDIMSGKIRGLGSATVSTIGLGDHDRHTKNVVITENFVTNLDQGELGFGDYELSAAVLRQLPFLPNNGLSQPYNWYGLNIRGKRNEEKSYVTQEMSNHPSIIHEKYNTLMRFLVRPDFLITRFVKSYTVKYSNTIAQKYINRNKQLRHAALQIHNFREYLLSNNSKKELKEYISELKEFKTIGKNFLFKDKKQDELFIKEEYDYLREASRIINEILSYKNNPIKLTKILLKHQLFLNELDWIPLYIAAEENHVNLIQACLDAKPMINPKTASTVTVLELATINGHKKTLDLLLNNKMFSPSTTEYFTRLFHLSAYNNHLDSLQLLLDKENMPTNSHHKTIFLQAVGAGFTHVVKTFCQTKMNIDLLGDEGKHAIHIAVQLDDVDMVKVLHEAKADLNILNSHGNSPLYMAAAYGKSNIVKLLCERKATTDLFSTNGCTPLHMAASKGNNQIVKILQESKADIYLKDKTQKWTPLSLASYHNHSSIVELLCQKPPNEAELSIIKIAREERIIFLATLEEFSTLKKWLDEYKDLSSQAEPILFSHLIEYVKNKNLPKIKEFNKELPQIFQSSLTKPDTSHKTLLLHAAETIDENDLKNSSHEIIEYLLNHYTSSDMTNSFLKSFSDILYSKATMFLKDGSFDALKAILNRYEDEVKLEPELIKKELFNKLISHTNYSNIRELNHLKFFNLILFDTLINMQTIEGNTPLLLAASVGNFKMIKYLLENKADNTIKNHAGRDYPFYLKHGINTLKENMDHETILKIVNEHKNIDLIQEEDIEKIKNFIFDDFLKNAKNGNRAIIENLQNSFPDLINSLINKQEQINGNTAILLAASQGAFEMVHWLITNGASLSIKNNKSEDFYELLNQGILKVFREPYYRTQLYELICTHFVDPLTKEITRIEENLFNEFLRWIKKGEINSLRSLDNFPLLAKALSNQKNINDDTALSYAAKYGHVKIMEWLFLKGALTPPPNRYGHNFLHYIHLGMYASAKNSRFNDLRVLLDEYKSDLSLKLGCTTLEQELVPNYSRVIEDRLLSLEYKNHSDKNNSSLEIEELTKNFPVIFNKLMSNQYKDIFFKKLVEQPFYTSYNFTYAMYWLAFHGWEIEKFILTIDRIADSSVKKILQECIVLFQHYSTFELQPDIEAARASAIKKLFSGFVYTMQKQYTHYFADRLSSFKELDKKILNLSKVLNNDRAESQIQILISLYKKYAKGFDDSTMNNTLQKSAKKLSYSQTSHSYSLRFWKKHDPKKHEAILEYNKKIEEMTQPYSISPASHI